MGAVLSFLNILWVAFVFVTMISVLVAAHELGHYLFARWFGMGVEEFAIGFGKNPLVIWKRKFYTVPLLAGQVSGIEAKEGNTSDGLSRLEGRAQPDRIKVVDEGANSYLQERTDFTVRPWPLGGFVRIKGMMPEDDGSETRIAGGFYSKSPWQRFLVLFAGPLFSVIAGIAILVPLYMLHGVKGPSTEPVIAGVVPGKPAEKAGFQAGDRILAIDGDKVATFQEMSRKVQGSGGKALTFLIDRKGKQVEASVAPLMGDGIPVDSKSKGPEALAKVYQIGAAPGEAFTRLNFQDATVEALMTPVQAATGLVKVFIKPSTFKENVGGPGTMFAATKQAVELGIPSVLWLSAMLSISVGIFNLLPAPPLDGGQMAIALAEMFRGGRRLSMRVQMAVGTAGFVFVCCLILSALTVDVMRFAFNKKEPPAAAKPAK